TRIATLLPQIALTKTAGVVGVRYRLLHCYSSLSTATNFLVAFSSLGLVILGVTIPLSSMLSRRVWRTGRAEKTCRYLPSSWLCCVPGRCLNHAGTSDNSLWSLSCGTFF